MNFSIHGILDTTEVWNLLFQMRDTNSKINVSRPRRAKGWEWFDLDFIFSHGRCVTTLTCHPIHPISAAPDSIAPTRKNFYSRLRDQFKNRDTLSERHFIENKNEIAETNCIMFRVEGPKNQSSCRNRWL